MLLKDIEMNKKKYNLQIYKKNSIQQYCIFLKAHTYAEKHLRGDAPELREKLGRAAGGQMEFCLIHAILLFDLESVVIYNFYNKRFI